jgi:hypothetical protein
VGRPADLQGGVQARYWVWTDDSGHHLRWTTPGERRRFAGALTWEGGSAPSPIVAVSDSGQASAPKIERGDPGIVAYEARCQGAIAGHDQPPSTARVTLALSLDGLPAPAHTVRLGQVGIRPRWNPFKLRPPDPHQAGRDHHPHPHDTPHPGGEHHGHPHPHPHPPGLGHHHPR